MATMVAMPAPRRALGELSESRYKSCVMTKNIQNAVIANQGICSKFNVPSSTFDFSSKIKRSFDSYDDDNENQENVDPALLLGSGKKAKGHDGEAVKAHKPTHFNLLTIKESAKIARSTLGVKSKGKGHLSKSSPPASAHKTKYSGIAGRHQLGGKRVVRIDPFAKTSVESKAPVSIDAALMGTVNAPATKPVLDIMPRMGKGTKSRHFVIHEDTPDEEMANLMEHSTCTLDISDDESRGKFHDDNDKENVPPPGAPAAAVRTVARRDMMTEEVRSPLGSLEAAAYYAADCDASSFIDAPQEALPEILDLQFGSIDGELRGDIKSKLNQVENAVISTISEAGEAGGIKSNIN
ncbi:MAG: hypothetical protein Q9220_003871 [cf. Caloplaca sp. 1 TL-2023]